MDSDLGFNRMEKGVATNVCFENKAFKSGLAILVVVCAYLGINAQSMSKLNVFVADKTEINSDIFGINNDWKFISNAQFPSFASKFSSLKLGVIRYPGGWESEWLDWSIMFAR